MCANEAQPPQIRGNWDHFNAFAADLILVGQALKEFRSNQLPSSRLQARKNNVITIVFNIRRLVDPKTNLLQSFPPHFKAKKAEDMTISLDPQSAIFAY